MSRPDTPCIKFNTDIKTACIKQLIVILLTAITVLLPRASLSSTAYLDITSDPESVDIYIDDKFVGRTPATGLEVKSGEIRVLAAKRDYGTATQTVTVEPDELKTVKIKLQPTTEASGEVQEDVILGQDRGILLIINQLGLVPVLIDGKKKGRGSIKLVGISTGNHILKVESFSKKIKIYKDYTLKVRVSTSGIDVLNDLETIPANNESIGKDTEKKVDQKIKQQEKSVSLSAKEKLIKAEEKKAALEKRRLREQKVVIISCYKGGCWSFASGYGDDPPPFIFTTHVREYKPEKDVRIDYQIVAQRDVCKYLSGNKDSCIPFKIEADVLHQQDESSSENKKYLTALATTVYLDGKPIAYKKKELSGRYTIELKFNVESEDMLFNIHAKFDYSSKTREGGSFRLFVERSDIYLP